MKDQFCDVEVGIHFAPYYRDINTGLTACARHKKMYEEREFIDQYNYDLGPYNWIPVRL